MNEYQEYLKTEHWQLLAEETKRLAGNRCQVCYAEGELHAHHRTYDRKGDELQSDLICLCKNCHEIFHKYIKIEINEPSGDVYKNIRIIWDEDNDDRVYEAIDIICRKLSNKQLPISVAEHEGGITIYWKDKQDLWRGEDCLRDGIQLYKGCDYWTVFHELGENP